MKRALLYLHLAVLLWGFTGVLGRAILLDAPVLVWWRMLLTAVFTAVILGFRKEWVPISRKDLGRLTLVGGLMGLHWVAFYAAIQFANASIALVCLSTSSVFTALLDPLVNRSERNVSEMLLGALALVGVYLIYQFQNFYGLGITFGMIAAALSSIFTMLNKRIADRYPARTMVFYEMGTGWLFLCLLLPLQFIYFPSTHFWPQQSAWSGFFAHPLQFFTRPNDWLWLVVLALCCTVWAQSLALNALKALSSFTVTLSVNMEPVYGILLAVLLYREDKQLGTGFYWGMSLILLSVVLQMLRLVKPGWANTLIRRRGGLD